MHHFHICFWGLICHINDGTIPGAKTHAALVDTDNTHQPKLILKSGASYEIDGNVTYAHGSGAVAAHAQHFRDWVPSLQGIIGGTLKPGVEDKTDLSSAVYVDYPAGDALVQLNVAHLYKPNAVHKIKATGEEKRHGRVARLVIARIPTNLSVIEFRFGSHVVAVDSDECVLISNLEKKSGGGATNHFEYFTKLVDNGEVAIADPGDDGTTNLPIPTVCSWVDAYIGKERPYGGVKPECGNTTFP